MYACWIIGLVRAADHGQPAVLVVVAKQRLAFERAMLQEGGPVLRFDDQIRPLRRRPPGRRASPHNRSARYHRPAMWGAPGARHDLDIEGVRQDLVVHLRRRPAAHAASIVSATTKATGAPIMRTVDPTGASSGSSWL